MSAPRPAARRGVRPSRGEDAAQRQEGEASGAPRLADRRGERPSRGEDTAQRQEGRASGAPRPDGKARPPAGRTSRPAHPAASRIEQVREALGDILQWSGPADQVLSRWFRAHPRLGVRDRGAVAEAVYDVLRHLRRYRQVAEGGRGAATRRLAVLGLASVQGPSAILPALDEEEAQWLRRVQAISPDALSPAVRLSVPDWLFEAIQDEPGHEALFAALNTAAPLDIRVNPMKADRDAILAELRAGVADAAAQPTPYSPFGIRVQGRPALNRWIRFEDGSIEVQDEGSQLLGLLVGPKRGEMVIDFCAGAGGKTLLLGALMRSTGRLYALDVSHSRLTRFKPRLARSGLSNVVPVVISNENDARVKRLARKAHRVLVDAPCSGTGTLRRNPDLKWRQSPQSIEALCETQQAILRAAARCVAPGGRLVYATCSILRAENEAQAEAFLASHPDFVLVAADDVLAGRVEGLAFDSPYLRLRPDVHGTDGFFAAVFERRHGPAASAAPGAADAEARTEADETPAPDGTPPIPDAPASADEEGPADAATAAPGAVDAGLPGDAPGAAS